MAAIAARPAAVAARALTLLRMRGSLRPSARVLIVGMAYKPGVADARESPALAIADAAASAPASQLAYHDPLVPARAHGGGHGAALGGPADAGRRRPRDRHRAARRAPTSTGSQACEHVLDATYRLALDGPRHLV